MKFKYLAFDAKNKNQQGVIEAATLSEATQLLLSQGLYIKKITPKEGFKGGIFDISFGGVSLVDKLLFVKHLGTMLQAGIDVTEALEVVADQTESKKFKSILRGMLSDVRSGKSLAASLSRYPKIFDQLYINIIKVGEESGTLEENLNYLAKEMENRMELRRNIRSAAFYPAIVLMATGGLGVVLAYFVLPRITKLFGSLDVELPASTKFLLWVSTTVENHGVLLAIGSVAFFVFFSFLTRQNFFKPFWHGLLIHMPIIGNIIMHYNLALIHRTMGTLLKSGLTINRSLEITILTTANVIYQKRLKMALPEIEKGKKLSDSLVALQHRSSKTLFPLLAIKMIGVGEKSGRLDESLSYLSSYFEKEVSQTTKNLTTILEPLLLITVGLVVGFIAISVISPIYQLTGQFRR